MNLDKSFFKRFQEWLFLILEIFADPKRVEHAMDGNTTADSKKYLNRMRLASSLIVKSTMTNETAELRKENSSQIKLRTNKINSYINFAFHFRRGMVLLAIILFTHNQTYSFINTYTEDNASNTCETMQISTTPIIFNPYFSVRLSH